MLIFLRVGLYIIRTFSLANRRNGELDLICYLAASMACQKGVPFSSFFPFLPYSVRVYARLQRDDTRRQHTLSDEELSPFLNSFVFYSDPDLHLARRVFVFGCDMRH
jgi:hypothetical protein